jgi:hypothetical protein
MEHKHLPYQEFILKSVIFEAVKTETAEWCAMYVVANITVQNT